jgi:tetratricopeptide (TPR) repeat protein
LGRPSQAGNSPVRLELKTTRRSIVRLIIWASLVIMLTSLIWLPAPAGADEQGEGVKSVFFDKGKQLMEEGDYGKAVEELKKVLLRTPNHKETRFLIGECYEKLGLHAKALKEFEGLSKLDPMNVEVHLKLAEILRSRVRYEEAIAAYEKVILLDEKRSDPYLALGDLYSRMNVKDRALDNYEKYLKIKPDSAGAHYEAAQILYQKSTRADENYGELLKRALQHFRRAMELDPANTETYVWLASLLSIQAQWAEAAEVCRKGLEVEDTTELRLKLSETLFNMGQIDGALVEVDRVLRREPDNVEAQELRERIIARREQTGQPQTER